MEGEETIDRRCPDLSVFQNTTYICFLTGRKKRIFTIIYIIRSLTNFLVGLFYGEEEKGRHSEINLIVPYLPADRSAQIRFAID